jgi:ankyrin repeat protein
MKSIAVLIGILLGGGLEMQAETGLFEAVRNGDDGLVRTLIRSGADPNTRNSLGATPLMYAAAFASPDLVRLLLDSGADVNARSNSGATALMWATGNTSNVRLLLERGAAVNAANKGGTTALQSAVLRENIATVKVLIAGGADLKGSAGELLQFAYRRNDSEMMRFLLEAGVERKNLDLRFSLEDAGAVRRLLDAGADPNAGPFLGGVKVPALGLAAFRGSPDAVRTLIEHGADPNRPDTKRRTPLMMAACRAVPDTGLVRFLIDKSADINARDETGRTALDWALTRGETEVAGILRAAGGKALVQQSPALRTPEHPRGVRVAIQAALDLLVPSSVASFERWQCVTCHHQSLPAIAVKVARDHGVFVHDAVGGYKENATVARTQSTVEDRMLGRGIINEYEVLALAERKTPANLVTDAMVHQIALAQQADGGWRELELLRPPLDSGRIPATALAVQALATYAPPVMRDDAASRIARARDYLLSATPVDTQDEAFKLLGLVWSAAPAAAISLQRQRLLKLQRDEGGWAQLPGLASDAFATGEVLYALHASGLAPDSSAYKKGVAYLLRTQLEDGTWLVRSRAFGFQPYLETGFPHGRDQFISAAATSWAAIALAYTL